MKELWRLFNNGIIWPQVFQSIDPDSENCSRQASDLTCSVCHVTSDVLVACESPPFKEYIYLTDLFGQVIPTFAIPSSVVSILQTSESD